MAVAIYPAIFFTVAMLVTTTYFMMGGLPLLILKHDTPLDAGFVQGFFNVYCKASLLTALGASVSYVLWGRPAFAAGAVAYVLIAIAIRRRLLPAMQRLGAMIQESEAATIRQFRKVHAFALSINLVQLVVLVWGTTQLSL